METLRETVATFDEAAKLEGAIDALERAGFDRADLSVLGQRDLFPADPATEAAANPSRAADDAAAPRDAVASDVDMRQGRTLAASMAGVIAAFAATGATIVTGGGALAAIVGAAAAGGGATIVAHAVGRAIDDSHQSFLRDQAERGGILLWVRLSKPEQEQRAVAILERHGGREIHTHAFTPDSRRVAVPEAGTRPLA